MSHAVTDTDVLIVGAGPVGLFLANECARRGLRYRIVEAHPTQSEHSKALAIFPRTMEIFDMAGVVGPFLEAANRVTSVSIIASGHRLAHMQFKPEDSPYQFVAMVPQDVTERLLVEQLNARGGAVEYETSFVNAIQNNDYVRVMLDHKGEREELTATFMVGCDGAHSTVRHLLNLPFEGAEYNDSFVLADIATNDVLPADELQLCPNEAGPVAIFPMSATRRRIVATVQHVEEGAPSLELVRQILRERAPAGIEARSLYWSSYFRIHHRQVAQLRVGRMFIAGDAAHIHSPFGGQGMNTGLHDVWNLSWKLDLAVHGHGNEELLASYSAERRPVIKQVIETTHFLTKALGTPNKIAQAMRNTVIPLVSRLAPFQHAFVQRLSELGVAYDGSPIVEGPGTRYFEESLRGGKGIDGRFLLFVDAKVDAATKETAQQLAGASADLVELRFTSHPGVKLVRPDGYIAYGSEHGDTAALESIRSLLKRQTDPDKVTASASRVA
jgi:2-polyprenyl-6-methoxyphenol hydroxylase-like FAD-dependent oxidoreductase